jgi:4-carboxymuconolactone decarboxylase
VSATEQRLGGRLALADPDALSASQRELFDHITSTWVPWAQRSGFAASTEVGCLIGPFNPTLLTPELASEFLTLQATEQQYTSLEERVRQVVILAVGAVWQAPYALYAHSAVAGRAGLAESIVAELVDGRLPDALTDAEKTAHRLAKALSTSHHVDDDLYRQAEQIFSAAGIFEMAILAGIYHTVCGILNVFNIPAPDHGA